MSDKLDLKTPDMVNLNIERIAALFPHCVVETQGFSADTETQDLASLQKKIDFDLLRQELSADIVEGPKERYRLEWPGKREAIVTANMPTTNTLRPVREDSVNFDTTENLYIEGDNLEVLKLLQESYLGKIKMIYIDPPYNTGNDFVYRDNFAQSTEEFKADSGMTDELGNRLVANPETAGRYHSDWLTMMYPRLKLARNLLTDDGVIFISIDDNEVHNLRKMCDEVFGEVNKLGMIANINNPKGRSDDKFIATAHEYILVYAKDVNYASVFGFEPDAIITSRYNKKDKNEKEYREIDLRKTGDADRRVDRPDMFYYFYCKPENNEELYISKERLLNTSDIEIIPLKDDGSEGRWRWGFETAKVSLNKVYAKFMPTRKIWGIFEKDYLAGRPPVKSTSVWTFKDVNSERGSEQMIELGFDKEAFSRPKPVGTLKRVVEIGTLPNEKSIVLDFFSGSAGLAQAIFELNNEGKRNNSFIMVQLPEKTDEKSEAYKAGYKNICEIGKERIRRAGAKIVEMSRAASQKAQEKGASLFDGEETRHATSLPDIGFRVYRLDTSNMQDVYYRPQDYKQQTVMNFANHIKPDRTADDLVAQVMLDWGLPLSLPIEQTTIADKTVYKVAGNALYCCFDEGIDEEFVRAMCTSSLRETMCTSSLQQQPLRIVFHDYAFAHDTAKENVRQLLKQLSAETEMRVV